MPRSKRVVRRLRYAAATVLVLAGPAVFPAREPADDQVASCRVVGAAGTVPDLGVNCAIADRPEASADLGDGPAVVPTTAEYRGAWPLESSVPVFPPPGVPLPVDLATNGTTGCVAGPGRPGVGTTGTLILSAAFDVVPAEAIFEFRTSAETDSTYATRPLDRPVATLDFEPGELGPGEIYRWRVRGTAFESPVPAWSDWCEFAVAADAPDLRSLDRPDIDAPGALGLRPEREYTVTLTPGQWRTALEMFDVDGAVGSTDPDGPETEAGPDLRALTRRSGSVTMNGAQWASLVVRLAEWANIVDEAALEVEPEFRVGGTATRAVLSRISRQLGGPVRVLGDHRERAGSGERP